MATDTAAGNATKVLIWRAALLRKLYPDGIPVMRYEDALQKLEIAEQISQSVVATDIEQKAKTPARPDPEPDSVAESNPSQEESAFSTGAGKLIDLLKSRPGLTLTAIMKELGYTQSYVYQLIGELRRAGVGVVPSKRTAKSKARKYQIVSTPMHENPEQDELSAQQ